MAGRGARGGGSWRDIASGGGNKSQDKLNPATTNGSGFSSHLKGSNVSNIDQRLLFTAQVLIGYTVQVTVSRNQHWPMNSFIGLVAQLPVASVLSA